MTESKVRESATGRQIARGAAWLMVFKLVDRSIGLVSTLILARILTPGDFGLIAMASAVVALTELMGAFGFDSALIQRQDTSRAHYDTAWTFNVILGLFISVVLVVMANPAATFYREPRLEAILSVLALGPMISAFDNIGTVAFRKELNFRSEFHFLMAKRIATFMVTIGLAVVFRSYWALIAGIITGKAVSLSISYILHPYRPRLDLSARAELFNFSKWLFISNLVQFLHNRSTDFILGRTVGIHGLGIYSVAVEIATMPSTELIAPLNRAVYPAYSRLAIKKDELRVRFIEVFGMICLIAFPVGIGILCVSNLIVKVFLGDQWLDAIPIIQICAISGLVGALQSNLYVVIVALGKPKANTIVSTVLLTISLPLTVFASLFYGPLGAAYAHFCTGIIGLICIVWVFSKLLDIKIAVLSKVLWRPLFGTCVMATALAFQNPLKIISENEFSSLLELFLRVTIGALIYIASVLVLWRIAGCPQSAEKYILNTIIVKIRG